MYTYVNIWFLMFRVYGLGFRIQGVGLRCLDVFITTISGIPTELRAFSFHDVLPLELFPNFLVFSTARSFAEIKPETMNPKPLNPKPFLKLRISEAEASLAFRMQAPEDTSILTSKPITLRVRVPN